MDFVAYCSQGHRCGFRRYDTRFSAQRQAYFDALRKDKVFDPYCTICGSDVYERCTSCNQRITLDAKYCGKCGQMMPWTEQTLAAARVYTDALVELDVEQKTELSSSLKNLTRDALDTPASATRVRALLQKVGPLAQTTIFKILENVITGEAKKLLGL